MIERGNGGGKSRYTQLVRTDGRLAMGWLGKAGWMDGESVGLERRELLDRKERGGIVRYVLSLSFDIERVFGFHHVYIHVYMHLAPLSALPTHCNQTPLDRLAKEKEDEEGGEGKDRKDSISLYIRTALLSQNTAPSPSPRPQNILKSP